MNRWRPLPPVLVILIAVAAGAGLMPSLSGCDSSVPLSQVLYSPRGSEYDLDPTTRRELARFQDALDRRADHESADRAARQFADAFKRVRTDYVREVGDVALVDAALKGLDGIEGEPGTVAPMVAVDAALDSMMASLDPHSAYLDPEELRESTVSIRGEFGGLGIEVTMEDGLVKVVSPIEDTPAARAGLQPGDVITHLDGDSIAGKVLMEAVRVMRGRPGTPLTLTVKRGEQPPFDVTIVRAVITVKAVRWHTEGDVGYIRVTSFSERVEDGVEQAMADIRAHLDDRLKGVVLDLRNNPGGLLDQSLALSDAFLDTGVIVSVRGRDAAKEQVYAAEWGDLARGLPLVVLINEGSASASEIVAGALQDNHRAVTLGQRSFGKGSVQTIMPLPQEGGLKFTTALYYSPAGHAIQARGVIPDIAVRPTVRGDAEADAKARPREADLPGALPALETADAGARFAIDEAACRPVGDKEDRLLGCALDYLAAGTPERFLAERGVAPSF